MRGRPLRLGLAALAIAGLTALSLRLATRNFPGFGPWVADGLRLVIGARAVTRLEEFTAAIEDRWNRLRPSRAEPRSLRDVETRPPAAAAPPVAEPPADSSPIRRYRPADVGPMNPRVAARDDGVWKPIADPAWPAESPLLFATLVHPDAKRPWAEVFVVAVDLQAVRLHAVAGTVEPTATTASGRRYRRHGLIPREAHERLLAAFNGGFKTEHGHHGMFVDGVSLVEAKPSLCTLVGHADGTLTIGTFRKLDPNPQSPVLFYRQTPGCMVEDGALNPLLRDEEVRNWGATIEGRTVIRRSAVGLDAARTTLFVSVSNDTTARAIADALRHAGAADVAQLDVNWSFPKILLFPPDANGKRRPESLFKGFVFERGEYLERPSPRDFFYLVRR
jgi:hypothetical protein